MIYSRPMRKFKFASLSEENRLLSRMTNWQNHQWLRAGGFIQGFKNRERNLDRINHFLNLQKSSSLSPK